MIFLMEQNMNQRRPGPAIFQRLLCNWPAALMGSMALAGAATAAQDQSAIAAATGPASTLYRVTNLGPGEGGVFINAILVTATTPVRLSQRRPRR